MRRRKKLVVIFVSIFLMFLSVVSLFGAIVYYDLSEQVKTYSYSDKNEYETITEGLDFLNKLPIQFNIINKYFSDFNHLNQLEKEQIVMSYALKNNYQVYSCGLSSSVKKSMCIKKSDLNSSDLLEKFGLNFKFENNDVNIYLDDYGATSVISRNNDDYYQFNLNNNNNFFRLYSVFDKYKVDDDLYIFYMYQGYFSGNCIVGEELSLYDFITGDIVYTGKCNGNNNFILSPEDSINKLQLYKYELKKNENGEFYLYGYNPVKSYND